MDWSNLHLEINEQTFFKRVYICDTIPKQVLWSLIRERLDRNVLNEVRDIPFSPRTLFNIFLLLAYNPKTYLRIYSIKIKSLLKSMLRDRL